MTKCEVCGKEGNTFTYEFGKNTGLEPICMCRACYGKLVLSMPKNPSIDQMKMAINKLFERAEEEKSRPKYKRY